jgi:hypothetical protein
MEIRGNRWREPGGPREGSGHLRQISKTVEQPSYRVVVSLAT